MRDVPAHLVVSEVFGPTFQGEGPSIGRRCGFVRLSGCNLNCAWCDTPYTWDWTGQNGRRYDPKAEATRMTLSDVLARVLALEVDLVIVSGGEPLLQQERLMPLLLALQERRIAIEIETNGTQHPSLGVAALATRFNVSPKLAHSGIPYDLRVKPAALNNLWRTGKAVFKFVCRQRADLDEVGAVLALFGPADSRDVWIMPEGTDAGTILRGMRELAEPTLAEGWNLTPRLQSLIWGPQRGR